MKIVNFEEFAALPKGTMFQYEGQSNHEIHIKVDTIIHDGKPMDFIVQPIGFLEETFACGDYTLDWGPFRDGLFEYDRRFIVYEDWDIERLKQIIDNRGKE